jgi:hypothetical protein
MTPNVIAPLVMAPLIVFIFYRRVRRNFGRQPVRPRRTWTRVAIFVVLTLLIGLGGLRDPRLAEGLAAGLVGGVALGLVGLRLTRFEITGKGDFYTPDPWIGLALTALLVGRLIYRFMVFYPGMQAASHAAAAGGQSSALDAYQSSPLTMIVFGLLFGYYIAYYAGVLIHHRRVLAQGAAA